MMAQVLHMETHFPGKSVPNSLSALKEPEAPYTVETPYGYRLDLDFLKYVDDIEKGHTIKRVPVSRRPRCGSLPRGPGYTGSWWTSTESLCSNASNDSRHSSYSYCGRGFYPAYEVRSGSSSTFNPRVERTLLDASKKLEAGQSRPVSLGCRSTSNLSTASLSRLPSSSSCQQLSSFTPLSSGMSTPVSPTPVHLQHVREQMAVALKRLRQLEEQVKMIPVLQVKISVLQEEKRQLSVQLKSQKYLGHPGGSPKGKTRGELYIEIPEEELKDGKNDIGTGEEGKAGDERTEGEDRKESEEHKEHSGTEAKKECLASNGIPVKKFCSVGVWVREADLVPHGPWRQLEADKQKLLVQALSAKVAVLERQLSRALSEVQNANRKLEEVERASRGEDTLKREKKEDVRADAVKVARVERGSEVVSSTEVGSGVQPQRSRDLEGRGAGLLKSREEEDRVYKSREVMEKPLYTSTGPPVHVHLVKKISITGQSIGEKIGPDVDNQNVEPSPHLIVSQNIHGAETSAGGSGPRIEDGTDFSVTGIAQDEESKSQFSGINGEMDAASSEDSGTMENPSDSESTESEYHEASEGPTTPQMNVQLPLTTSIQPKDTEKHKTSETPVTSFFPTSPVPRVELSNVLISGCVALQKSLDDPAALTDTEKAAAHEAVTKEWMKIFRQKEVDPAIIRHHLNVFRAMSPRLLEVIINMADTKGNTAVHYAVSQSNFTVVRQLLDTGLCDVNRQNKAGFTPLMLTALAAFHSAEDIETVTQMLRLGDVNCRASQAGQTALMLAVSHGRLDVVRALLQCGADVNVQDHDGSTALMCACEHGHVDIVSLLLAVPSCDMALTDNDGSTALSIALEAGQNDIAMLLYAHNAKSSAAGREKNLKTQSTSPSDESQ
ncbi:KN motif and ankyrin repeat domain-containing protein 2 isoform X1 [Hyla sarda]|uniref:KN motif and ankyrin repeat domain-containing protein 2 isoform X1 n=1 Tax=Hyla sarda TaxID=327740 RepID=UPI0024C34E48|nr:KN motif and ankyrin repeat domain-containing protein 2 isoform X1 [Hyla sarda]XP_056426451.1 KN motif and ankyrin repeat domain-containing protein 2 isoform X1 [Hyla sarda]XP_056426453.1 KN motif and ankyrin repeat domain-containing protein 2 isoform X1 [Hyla sarda]XP_056426454.1 KN motif and ankyrin repeat domain-containing protein 2 isoform X1 [Hyla sarda]XP_056426455.1 KN motif and ankyrin repeat domain-containing protein 2 isoform X1 [Hyla sarda]XP_056426456.1 KN motif and ankyrin repe